MDSVFGIKGKDFVLIASETTVLHSIFKLKHEYDKSYRLDDNALMSIAGAIAD